MRRQQRDARQRRRSPAVGHQPHPGAAVENLPPTAHAHAHAHDAAAHDAAADAVVLVPRELVVPRRHQPRRRRVPFQPPRERLPSIEHRALPFRVRAQVEGYGRAHHARMSQPERRRRRRRRGRLGRRALCPFSLLRESFSLLWASFGAVQVSEPVDAAAQRPPQDGLVKLATDRDGREVHRLGEERREQRALEPDARPRRELVAARQHPPSRGRSGGNEASDVVAAAAGRDRAIPRGDVFSLGSVRFIGPEPCAPRFRRLARGRPRVFLVQERDLPLLHRAPARASVVVGPRRCLEGAEAVHEPLLRALGPPLDGRVAAGRGGRVQVKGDGRTDAISLAGALEHRPRLGRVVACRTASGFRRRRGEGGRVLPLARALATGRDGGRLAMGASSLGGELRVEETLEPPAR